MSRTEAPARAAAIAAVDPAEPDPTTHTSTSAMVGAAVVQRHGAGSGDTESTDQPPSTLSIWPVTTRDSSDRKKIGRLGDLVGVQHLAGERLLAAGVGEDRRVVGGALGHRGPGQGRRDDVDPDPVRARRSRPSSSSARSARPWPRA